MGKPKAGDYGSFYETYINHIDANHLSEVIANYAFQLNDFFISLPNEKAEHRYAPNKWSLKDLLQHLIDTERIMSYRLLRIARKDTTPLTGFEEKEYAIQANASNRSFISLKDEFVALRRCTDLLIQSLTEDQLANAGTASGYRVTANAIGYIIFGHLIHHKIIIEERYL